MSTAQISHLRSRRSSIQNDITYTRNQISIVADKITRLETAISSLKTNIADLKTIRSSINKLSIDNSRWKGTNETKFDTRYSSYRESVDTFYEKTVNAKEGMQDDLRREQNNRAMLSTNLVNLQNSLSSIDSQIRWAERQG